MGHTLKLAANRTVAFTTRRRWPFVLTLADVAWGAAASAACAAVVRSASR